MNVAVAEFETGGMSAHDVLAIVRRRRRPMFIALGAGVVTTLLLVFLLPPRYESTATILIEQQELASELVRSSVTSYADERIQVITQRAMTTQNLLDLIRRYDLYPRARERETREALVRRMRDDVAVKMISADVVDPRSGHPTTANIAFSISYANSSPDQAARVANELTTLFLNENVTTRTRVAQEAQDFLTAEADRVSGRIADLESKLAAFKAKNSESLPELTQLNMSLLDRTEQQISQLETRRDSLATQTVYLESQLAQIKPHGAVFSETGERIMSPADRAQALRTQLASARALYAPGHPDIVRYERELAGLEAAAGDPADPNDLRRQIEAAKLEAAEASRKYAPEHPDRIRLEREVSTLEEELATAERTSEAKPATAKPVTKPDNPLYMQAQGQLEANQADLKAIDEQLARLHAQAADYRRHITVGPQVEKEYRELQRDYDAARAKYQELRAKQAEATVSRDLEADRKGERFTLIEPPLVPEEPASPNRPLVAGLGLFASLLLGAAVVALLETFDATVHDRRDLALLLGGAAPLAVIPLISTDTAPAEHAVSRSLKLAGWTLLALAAGLALVHFLYRPLDVLWFVVLRKLGFG